MKKWRCQVCGYLHRSGDTPEYCPVCAAESSDFEPMEETEFGQPEAKTGRIIIIGNGAAGIEAARIIRERNKATEILMFSDESYHFYSRIHLSTFIGEDSGYENIAIYQSSWYKEQNIQVLLDTPVAEILPERKEVRDSNGKWYSYHRLIIAAGAHPFLPSIKGADKKGVFVLRNLNHALQIREFAFQCKNAVIIGGGILGIEAASSLQKRGLSVSVVEIADHIMPLQLDRACAGVLQYQLEMRGIMFRLASRAVEFLGNNRLQAVRLESGEELPAELVLIAAGMVPNTDLARRAGLTVNRGIVVNEYLQTCDPDIFAAGDVAEFRGTIYGIWSAAVDQGVAAGENVLHISAPYTGTTPLHILKVAGVDMTALGQKYKQSPAQTEIIHLNKERGEYVKLIHDGDYLLGAIVMGMPGIGFRLERILKRRKSIKEMVPDLEKGHWSALKRKG